MTGAVHVALIPRDGLFCKDGRGWHTSALGRGHALDWPWPSTILGAIRTAWGRNAEAAEGRMFDAKSWQTRTAHVQLHRSLIVRKALRGEFAPEDRVWPVPADAVWLEGAETVQRLQPHALALPTLGRDDSDAREHLLFAQIDANEKPMVPPRWWRDDHFIDWLCGGEVPARSSGNFTIPRRVQAHVGISADTLAAEDGVLFAHDVVETLERDGEWAIAAEVTLPSGGLPERGTLGGDGRPIRIEHLDPTVFAMPERLRRCFRTPTGGLRLITVTPAEFSENGWYPDFLRIEGNRFVGRIPQLDYELILRSAIVNRPVHISGWDQALGRPKKSRRMVPPGAVYFFERADGAPFSLADAEALWLGTLDPRANKVDADADQGFGRVVPGIWDPPRS